MGYCCHLPDDQDLEIEIPLNELSHDALLGVIDDFILREGTDYGRVEVTFEQKRAQILAQLRSGKARLMFDPRSQTCTIVPAGVP